MVQIMSDRDSPYLRGLREGERWGLPEVAIRINSWRILQLQL